MKDQRKVRNLNYDREHDACGIGAVVNIDGHADYRALDDALRPIYAAWQGRDSA